MTKTLQALRAEAQAACAALLDAARWELPDADEATVKAVRMDGGRFGVEYYPDRITGSRVQLVVCTAGGRRKPLAWPVGQT
jgi:hypothetical protein